MQFYGPFYEGKHIKEHPQPLNHAWAENCCPELILKILKIINSFRPSLDLWLSLDMNSQDVTEPGENSKNLTQPHHPRERLNQGRVWVGAKPQPPGEGSTNSKRRELKLRLQFSPVSLPAYRNN